MQHTLKLTITAVGENDSVFLTPCDPVTLHESSIEDAEKADDPGEQDHTSGPTRGDDALAASEGDDVMVMIED